MALAPTHPLSVVKLPVIRSPKKDFSGNVKLVNTVFDRKIKVSTKNVRVLKKFKIKEEENLT